MNWRKLEVWLLGLLWAGIMGASPAAVVVIDWVQRWNDPIDWTMVAHIGIAGALGGVIGYWRKYKALLELPPLMKEAIEMQKAAADKSLVQTP